MAAPIAAPPDIGDLYRTEALGHRLLTHAEEISLATQAHRGSSAARETLILCNQRLVWNYAARYAEYARDLGMDTCDLVSEGNVGLIRAVEGYDPTRGYRFSTYATWWIRQALGRAIAERGYAVRRPVHMSENMRALRRTQAAIEQETGRAPTVDEIAGRMGRRPEVIQDMLELAQKPRSLDERLLVQAEDSSTLGELLAATDDVADQCEETLFAGYVAGLLDQLPTRHATVLRLRYGLGAGGTARGDPLTLEECGKLLGVTRERVRQLQGEAMGMLRAAVRQVENVSPDC